MDRDPRREFSVLSNNEVGAGGISVGFDIVYSGLSFGVSGGGGSSAGDRLGSFSHGPVVKPMGSTVKSGALPEQRDLSVARKGDSSYHCETLGNSLESMARSELCYIPIRRT